MENPEDLNDTMGLSDGEEQEKDVEEDIDQEIEDGPVKKKGRGRPASGKKGKTKTKTETSKSRGRPSKRPTSVEGDVAKDEEKPPKKKRKKIQRERTIQPGTLRDTPRKSYKDESSSEEEKIYGSDASSDSEADYKLEQRLSRAGRPVKKEAGSLRDTPRKSYKDDSASDIESGFESDVLPPEKKKTKKKAKGGKASPKKAKAEVSSAKKGRGRPKKEKSEEEEVEKPEKSKPKGRPKGTTGEGPPECVFCMEPYSIEHIILECADLLLKKVGRGSHLHNKYKKGAQVEDLSDDEESESQEISKRRQLVEAILQVDDAKAKGGNRKKEDAAKKSDSAQDADRSPDNTSLGRNKDKSSNEVENEMK